MVVFLTKVVGSGFILLSGFLMGISCASRLEATCREIERLERALFHLETEISYGLTPLPRALAVAGEMVGGIAGAVFLKASELVGRRGGMVPGEALKDALASEDSSLMGREAREVLLEMAAGLGTSGRTEQIALIEQARRRIRAVGESAQDRALRHGKLYRYLGVLGAIVLVLLLV